MGMPISPAMSQTLLYKPDGNRIVNVFVVITYPFDLIGLNTKCVRLLLCGVYISRATQSKA
jgi:hypothetical protein